MTYNVHRCVGIDGKDSYDAVAELCARADADVIALQELDAPETDEDVGAHHARELSSHLGMQLLFCRTFRNNVGYYGHALLSRYPIALRRVTTFPSLRDAEPRGAIWARIALERGTLDVFSTHLGVYRSERAAQVLELVSRRWLGSTELEHPCILCGDLNAVPDATTYRRIAARMRDAQRVIPGHKPRSTFPSFLPFLRLDHVFVSDDLDVRAARVPYDALSRRASDHLPLIVDLEV